MIKLIMLSLKTNLWRCRNMTLLCLLSLTYNWLRRQVAEWEERYDECLSLLRTAQQEIRELQKAKKPDVIRYHYSNDSPYISGDSLAVQLENSIRRSLLYPDDSRYVCDPHI